MQIPFTEAEINAKAAELGIIQFGDGPLPRHRRSGVVAILLQEAADQAPRAERPEPQLAKEIVIQPNGSILVDGEELPWLVAKEPMQIGLNPDGVSTVRLTLLAGSVQIIKPEPQRESEQPQ